MKKRVWKGKRLFSLLLAFVMLASIMPLELLVGAISPREEPADISVVMSAEPEKVALNGTSTVTLAVTLKDEIDYATIHIELSPDEISAIQNQFWENTEGDTDAVLLNEGENSPKVTLEENTLVIKTFKSDTWEFTVRHPETLVEGEGAPADESEKFEFSVENDDITLKCFEWVPEDVTSPEPESGTEGPLSDNSTGETDSSADVPVTPADETDTPTDVPETSADETDTSTDVPETSADETDTPTDVPVTPADETDTSADVPVPPTDEEPEEPGDAAVEGGAVYETVTLAASTGGEENENDDNGNGGDSRNESGKEPPTTYFKGVTVTFTDQEEEQAPENPGFTLSLSTDSEITPVDRKLPDFTFTATAELNEDAVVAEGDSISFQLQIQLPEGITFPEGIYFSEVGTNIVIKYTGEGETGGTVAEIPLPVGVEVGDITAQGLVEVSEDLSTLTLSITQSLHASPEQPEGSSWTYAVTVHGAVLEIADGFTSGTISITSDHAQESGGELAIQVDPVEVELDERYRFSEEKTFQKTIYWRDNNDEGGVRPETGDFPIPYNVPLQFRIGGEAGQWVTLDESNMAEVGLRQMPELQVSDKMNGVYTLTYEGLNTQRDTISPANPDDVTKSERIDWQFGAPPVVAGYDPDVVDDGAGSWTYCLLTDFNFTAQLRWGDLGSGEEVQNATGETFSLYYIGKDNQPVSLGTLKDLEDQGRLTYENQSTTPIITDVTISGYPEYDPDGNPIQYYVDLTAGHDETLDSSDGISALTGEDKITASFSNAGVPGYDAVSDRIYSGGTLTLTLTGTTSFSATKVWLDQAIAVEDKETSRPDVSYSLWRRREGTSYHESQQLTNYTVKITSDSAGGENVPSDRYALTVQEEDGKLTDLPKYDSDGYPYVYFLKESMSGQQFLSAGVRHLPGG